MWLHAICWAEACVAVDAAITEATRVGYITAHSSACMPPMDPPITHCHRRIPNPSANEAWVRTMSRMDTTGKLDP